MALLGSGGKPATVTMTGQHNVPVPCQSPTGAVVMDWGMWRGHDTCPVCGIGLDMGWKWVRDLLAGVLALLGCPRFADSPLPMLG